jgi:ABC-type siderophore export system fused ATPase/permease subunit
MLALLVRFFKREGYFSFWRNTILIAIVSGIANAGLLAIINIAAQSAKDETLNYFYMSLYVVVFTIFFSVKKYL